MCDISSVITIVDVYDHGSSVNLLQVALDIVYCLARLSLAAAILCLLTSSLDRPCEAVCEASAPCSKKAEVPAGLAVVSSKNPVGVAVGVIGAAASTAPLPVSLILSVIPNVPFLIPFSFSAFSASMLAWSVACVHRSVRVDLSFLKVSI